MAKIPIDRLAAFIGVGAPAVFAMLSQPVNASPVMNSACYSPITATTAAWVTAIFHYDPLTKIMKTPGALEAESPTTDGFETMGKWFANLMKDTFG